MLKQCVARLSLARPARHPAHRAHGRDDDEETADETCTGELHADRLCALRRGFVLVDANGEILCGGLIPGDLAPRTTMVQLVARVLEQREASTASRSTAAGASSKRRRSAGPSCRPGRSRRRRWTPAGRSLPRIRAADGGVALVSVDVTETKRAQLVHLENVEVFRCITESHPLPVWVVDEATKEILYESLDASNLLGRKWRPEEAAAHHRACRRRGRFRHDQRAGRQA